MTVTPPPFALSPWGTQLGYVSGGFFCLPQTGEYKVWEFHFVTWSLLAGIM